MNIFIISTIILNFITIINALNYMRLRNLYLKIFICNKKNINLIKQIKKNYKNYCTKTLLLIGKKITDYENLSEDNKMIIETIISLYY